MLWRCPEHHGSLATRAQELVAGCCGRAFPVLDGIPDFRIMQNAWVDAEEDRQRARELIAAVAEDDVAGSVRFVFARRTGWSEEMVAHRAGQVLAAADRLHAELTGWLAPVARHDGPILDLGCGPGMLLAALQGQRTTVGIDVSLEWLVVARRLSLASGVRAHLAAGYAEALPLASGSIGGVCALDVLEHVGDQAATVREVNRVLMPGGVFAAATPNRFSLASEPHVNLWGVGWLPRAWQSAYVRRRSGLSYAFTRLLSARELRALLHDHSSLHGTVEPAAVPPTEIERMGGRRRALARAYNGLIVLSGVRSLARGVGPFFHLIAVKDRATEPGHS